MVFSYNFFFNPPAHLCAVTYMTEISLIVTLNNQIHSLTEEIPEQDIVYGRPDERVSRLVFDQ